MATEVRQVSGFDAIELRGIGSVKITQGDAEELRIEADSEIIPQIKTAVEGTTLVIRYDVSWSLFNVGFLRPIEFHVTAKTLSALTLEGAGMMTGGGLDLGDLTVTLAGAGRINLGMHAKAVKATLAGAGALAFAGRADSLDMRISGAGEYEGSQFETATAKLEISGAGSAVARVRDELDARIAGAGSVNYYGDPKVTQSLGGAGSIKKAG